MDDHSQENTLRGPTTARRRTAYACVQCRSRKTRCDGQDPCGACRNLDFECHYDHAVGSTKAKSDLILSAILRLEGSISAIDSRLSGLRQDVNSFIHHPPAPHLPSPFVDHTSSHSGDFNTQDSNTRSDSGNAHQPDETNANHEFSNATISSSHTSTTETILHWPVFNVFPELRGEGVLKPGAIFLMENSRQTRIQHNSVMPLLSEDEVDRLILAFQRTTNFFYPIVSKRALDEIRDQYLAHEMDYSTKSCLALLIMALGCAAETVAHEYNHDPSDTRKLVRLRSVGRNLFDAAVSRLHTASASISVESMQCLALTALYYAYLQRPIQAWSMLSATATACQAMVAYYSYGTEEIECVRRVFWMCYILESDYLAELPLLPHFGIGEMESSVPLPGEFVTHENETQVELSSLYFLACISMRRLLNRCHHLLYGDQHTSPQDSHKLSVVVSELDQQLENWRRFLPPALTFAVDDEPANSQYAGFLRQRYLTCRSLIYRTYVMEAISDHISGRSSDHHTVEGAGRCLQASILHIMNLQPFNQTILVDMWICSLSMAGTMMILLAALSTASLASCLSEKVSMTGGHLLYLLEHFAEVHGESRSPSVHQAIEWIRVIDRIIRRDNSLHDLSVTPASATSQVGVAGG